MTRARALAQVGKLRSAQLATVAASAGDPISDMDWTAHSFLCRLGEQDREAQAILGFSWGFVIRDGMITPRGPDPLASQDWDTPTRARTWTPEMVVRIRISRPIRVRRRRTSTGVGAVGSHPVVEWQRDLLLRATRKERQPTRWPGEQLGDHLGAPAPSAGEILGPLAAGVLVATAGAGWAIAADAVTFGPSRGGHRDQRLAVDRLRALRRRDPRLLSVADIRHLPAGPAPPTSPAASLI